MKELTQRQKKFFEAVKKLLLSKYGKVTLWDVAEELNSSPTKLFYVMTGLRKKGYIATKWGGHSLGSIIII